MLGRLLSSYLGHALSQCSQEWILVIVIIRYPNGPYYQWSFQYTVNRFADLLLLLLLFFFLFKRGCDL